MMMIGDILSGDNNYRISNMWRDAVMFLFEIRCLHFPGGLTENKIYPNQDNQESVF
jgi:hypothetical protein